MDEILGAFTYEVKNKKPDVLIISGDLTSNGEKKSHVDLAEKLKEIEKAGTAIYVVRGNHDVLNPCTHINMAYKQLIKFEGCSKFTRL